VTVNIGLFGSLDEVAHDAAGALDRAERSSLFERLTWFRLVAAHCPPPGRLLAIRAEKNGARAWLMLAVRGHAAEAYANWYSLRVGSIGSDRDDVMTSLGNSLRKQNIACLELIPVERPEPLATGLSRAGWVVRIHPGKANWRIDTTGMNFAAYWAARPAKLRNTFRRRAKAAGLEVRIHAAFDAQVWADYEAVYRASWKPEEGSFPFLRAFAEQEGAAGTLRLGLAYKDGAPIAAQLWLVENSEATIHKLAYAEDAKALSPGTILTEALFRHVLDRDRVNMIDYGIGDEPYKADWMSDRRMLWRLTAYDRRSLRGLAAMARDAASVLAGRWRSG
jgi:hypothetical protein